MYAGTSCIGSLCFSMYVHPLHAPPSPSPFPSPPPPSQDEGIPPLNASLNIIVRVDPEPPVFNQTFYTANVPEFTGEVSQQAKVVTYTHSPVEVFVTVSKIVSSDQCHF